MAGRKPLEEKDPEKAKVLTEALSEPGATIRGVARETGLPTMTVQNFYARNKGVLENSRTRKWEDLGPLLKKKAFKAFDAPDEVIEKASLRDRAIFGGIAVDKGFLIEGRSTQNISFIHEHRHSVPAFLEALRKELERRAVECGSVGTTVEAELEDAD